MHSLKIINQYGVQIVELDNPYGDSGTWRQIKPIAPRAGQTLKGAHGTWKWDEEVRSQVSGRTMSTLRLHEFKLMDFSSNTVSLGFFVKKKLPTARLGRAFKEDLNNRHFRVTGHLALPSSSLLWQYNKQVNYAEAWAGLFVKIGGQLAVAGKESAIGVIYNISTGARCKIAMETGRIGPGLGGSIGLAVGVFTGFPNTLSMESHNESGWDFSVAFTAKLGAYAKAAGQANTLSKLSSSAPSLSRIVKAGGDVTPKLAAAWEGAGNAGDTVKASMADAGRLADDNPTIRMLDVPPAGAGLELGAFKTWTQVTKANPY